MVNLIIAEDEPLMNEYIVNSLDWSSLGINLCGVFFDGKSAYEFLLENKVDIVITDIQMPQLDGLSLIADISANMPDTKFVILSNFDNFHMVKDAFKYGATEYILKTEFDPKTFRQLLSDIISKLPHRKTDKLSVAICEITIRQFFWDSHTTQAPKNLRIKQDDRLSVAVVKLLNYNNISKLWSDEKELMKFGLSNCIDEIIDSFGNCEFFFNNYDEIIFLLSASEYQAGSPITLNLFDTIFSVLNKNFEIVVSAGICDMSNIISLTNQYSYAIQALEYYFFFGINTLIPYTKVLKYNDVPDIKQLSERADDLLNSFSFNELYDFFNEFNLTKPNHQYISAIRDFYIIQQKGLLKICETYGITDAMKIWETIDFQYASSMEIIDGLTSMCKILIDRLAYSDTAIVQIRNYIQKNYAQNITLRFLAKHFLFDYTDLSRRFQKATGMTFPKFLNNIRLNEAMKLIQTTDFKCTRISTMVGYNNYESFSRSFKNKFKKWPNEIRKAEKQ